MNLLELRYFLAAYERRHINQAAGAMKVSAGAISKAIRRLEDELGVALTVADGRGIRMTEAGDVLAAKAGEILRMEEEARVEVMGRKGPLRVAFAGPEVLLLHWGRSVASRVRELYPEASFEFTSTSEDAALERLMDGRVNFAVVASELPDPIQSVVIAETNLHVAVAPKHPLYRRVKAGKAVAVKELTDFPFACPSVPLFGNVSQTVSLDGWHDEEFPRRVAYRTSCLKMLEHLLADGCALVCMPREHLAEMNALPVKIDGYRFRTGVSVRLAARQPERTTWSAEVFQSFRAN